LSVKAEHFKLPIGDNAFTFARKTDAIAAGAARWTASASSAPR
jgi:hypothetical protein